MPDEKRETISAELRSSSTPAPRQLIEGLIENLQKTGVSSPNAKKQFSQSIRLLDQCIVSRKEVCAYADAVERAPWLTGEFEQLKGQWNQLRKSLHMLYRRTRRGEVAQESLIRQFNEFAERFVDCEADEECFLHAAFPGPDWIDENQGIQPF